MDPDGSHSLLLTHFRDFYAGMKGLHPERFGPIRLREESE